MRFFSSYIHKLRSRSWESKEGENNIKKEKRFRIFLPPMNSFRCHVSAFVISATKIFFM